MKMYDEHRQVKNREKSKQYFTRTTSFTEKSKARLELYRRRSLPSISHEHGR